MSYVPSCADAAERRRANSMLPKGDSFERIVREYTPLVKRAAYNITQNIDDARDVAQFVFMQMYVTAPQLDTRRAIERWLYVVARNKALEIVNRRHREDMLATLESGHSHRADLEEIVMQNERSRTVRAAIAALPDRQRELIELRHLMSLAPGEIAAHFGISPGHLKRQGDRAIYRLRAEMRRCRLDGDLP